MTDHVDIERLPSGIAGLDTVLRGGFLRGGIYIAQGVPGAGKTILGNQICYNHAAAGNRALYLTLLAESHARMLLHLRQLRFFDQSVVPDPLSYISGFDVLEGEGLKGLLTLIRREVQARQATVLVLDGFVAAEEMAGSAREFKRFIHELQTLASAIDCTMFLLTSAHGETVSAEHTMVDGVIELADEVHGARAERRLEIRKFRGSDYLRGRHAFRIADEGIIVFPRVEALNGTPQRDGTSPPDRMSVGIGKLDAMLGGGLSSGTATLLLGVPGIGKTTIGLHFLAAASAAEPGLLFGFYEAPSRLLDKARGLGLALGPLIERGELEVIWQAPAENILDELGHRLLDRVKRRKVKRLFIDGVAGFSDAAISSDRIGRFFTALTNELRGLGVATIYASEMNDLVGPEIELPVTGLGSIAENIILLRLVELRATLRRLLSVVKMRSSDFDMRFREFIITGHGIDLADTFESAEAVLTGYARERMARGASGSAARKGRTREGGRSS